MRVSSPIWGWKVGELIISSEGNNGLSQINALVPYHARLAFLVHPPASRQQLPK
jgi:hypothetical protein